MDNHFKLIGIGLGPFNLSVAALLAKSRETPFLFLEQKPGFDWHSEVMFRDSNMQTSYMKDLVTPIDPTSPYSFLNYLVQNGLFYSFMHTHRNMISRREFEMYCQWVCSRLGDRVQFRNPVLAVQFERNRFAVQTRMGAFTSDHLCIATGSTSWVPECVTDSMGPDVFHAKSGALAQMDLREKDVVIIGGGQTGIEVFRNGFGGKWGRPRSMTLITRRNTLEPLDEAAFTNEYFTPHYVQEFLKLPSDRKGPIVEYQRLASDGNTPAYLSALYDDLYRMKYVDRDPIHLDLLACRRLEGIFPVDRRKQITLFNEFLGRSETLMADTVILCTGFRSTIPKAIDPIRSMIHTDSEDRFVFRDGFSVAWEGPVENKVYALNFGRHHHGISEPQTSLMAWRAATVVNDVLKRELYFPNRTVPNFVRFS